MASLRCPMAWLLGVSVIWGSSWIANSMLREEVAPLRVAGLRYLLAGIVLALAYGLQLLIQHVRRSAHSKHGQGGSLSRSSWAHLQQVSRARPLEPQAAFEDRWMRRSILLGMTMFALPELLLAGAAYHGVAAWAPLIYAALPLGLSLAAGEPHPSAVLGLGAMLMLLNGSLPVSGAKVLGALWIAAAVAMQGWSLIYARRHLAVASSLRGIVVQLITAFCVTAFAAQLAHGAFKPLTLLAWPASSWAALTLLAALGTALAYPLYYRLLRQLEPAQLAVSAWLQTVVAVGESAWLLRQRPQWMMSASAAVLVACAVWLVRRSDADKDPQPRLLS